MAREKLEMLGLVRLRGAPAVGALRRPAAARRGRALAGARARGAAVRRAAVESRRQAAPARARGDPRAAAVARADRALRDARPGGGARGLRPYHRDERRPHRAAGNAATSCTRRRRAASSPTSSATPTWSTASSRSDRAARRSSPAASRRRCAPTAWRRVRRRWRCARSGCASSTPAQGVLPGICKRVAYLGSRIEYVVATALGRAARVRQRERAPRAAATFGSASIAVARRGVAGRSRSTAAVTIPSVPSAPRKSCLRS